MDDFETALANHFEALDTIEQQKREIERLRKGLARFAARRSWWEIETSNVHGMPVTVYAWTFGSLPWETAQNVLDNSEDE